MKRIKMSGLVQLDKPLKFGDKQFDLYQVTIYDHDTIVAMRDTKSVKIQDTFFESLSHLSQKMQRELISRTDFNIDPFAELT